MDQVRFLKVRTEKRGKNTNAFGLRSPDALVGFFSNTLGNGDKFVASALELCDGVLKDLVPVG